MCAEKIEGRLIFSNAMLHSSTILSIALLLSFRCITLCLASSDCWSPHYPYYPFTGGFHMHYQQDVPNIYSSTFGIMVKCTRNHHNNTVSGKTANQFYSFDIPYFKRYLFCTLTPISWVKYHDFQNGKFR